MEKKKLISGIKTIVLQIDKITVEGNIVKSSNPKCNGIFSHAINYENP